MKIEKTVRMVYGVNPKDLIIPVHAAKHLNLVIPGMMDVQRLSHDMGVKPQVYKWRKNNPGPGISCITRDDK